MQHRSFLFYIFMFLIVVNFDCRDDTLITEISNTLQCNKPVKYDFCIAVNDVGNIKYLENCFIVFLNHMY